MRSILVVGGDQLGCIKKNLKEVGFDEVLHISGRKKKMTRIVIPKSADAILVLTDFVNHNLSNTIKQKAMDKSLPIMYAKRSWCSIYQSLQYRQ